ncbi:MAG: Fic family protein [Lentisphaeraceae bacterium]|nr:Fic family protein [Lentisphaeraceae bacterium]
MNRFSLKVTQELFESIKKNGKQQAAVDAAVDFLTHSQKKLELNQAGKLSKQLSFSLSDQTLKELKSSLKVETSRELLKQIRQALDYTVRKKTKVGLFLNDLDDDLKNILKHRIRDEWTHDSTSIEGNTLSLGETSFILKEGLTISGKSVHEHDEVRGHANAIELIYHIAHNQYLTEEDIFNLHRAIMINPPFDIENPVGAWKKKENGAYWGKEYILYPSPKNIPQLMTSWLETCNSMFTPETATEAVKIYTWTMLSFTSIHPFFDGNGRLARLLANLRVIQQGFPPITIDSRSRFDYLGLIKKFRLRDEKGSLEMTGDIKEFEAFIYQQWQKTLKIVDEVREIQRQRS